MKEKQIFDKINTELNKMLASGFINETQCKVIAAMVKNITTTKEELRVSYSDDGKHAYFNGNKFRKNFSGYYVREIRLHIAVMEYYTGEDVPTGIDVHHNGKDENGNYDKSKNDIENLLLIPRNEHQRLHATNETAEVLICPNCCRKFKKHHVRQKYCCQKCNIEYHAKRREEKIVKRKCAFPNCEEEFEVKRSNFRKYCNKHLYGRKRW